ncbi:MAG: hypothetical protein AAGA56_11160 [Myxococcota bacterium]
MDSISTGGAGWNFLYPALVVRRADGRETRIETSAEGRASLFAHTSPSQFVFDRRPVSPLGDGDEVWLYDVCTEEETLLGQGDLRERKRWRRKRKNRR